MATSATSGVTELIRPPGCMRCDQLCSNGEEIPRQECDAIARQASNKGNAASSGRADPAVHKSAHADGVMEPMVTGEVQLPNLDASKLAVADKPMLEINCCKYQDPNTRQHWWSCSHNSNIWFKLAGNDSDRSECGHWVKTMSPMWTNKSQGYVFFEEVPAWRFMLEDDTDCDSDHGAIEPTVTEKDVPQILHSSGTSDSSSAPVESGGTGDSAGTNDDDIRELHRKRFEIGGLRLRLEEEKSRLEKEKKRLECEERELEEEEEAIQKSMLAISIQPIY